MVNASNLVTTIIGLTGLSGLAKADYIKLDAKKLRGSWAQQADVEKTPLYAYYKGNLNSSEVVNGTVAGLYNENIYYVVDLAIGSNAQNVTVLVDTLSSDLWINSVDNEVCAYGVDEELGSNFTIAYEFVNTITSSSSTGASATASISGGSSGPVLSTITSSRYDSSSDAYFIDVEVVTETTDIATVTSTHVSTTSHDIQFYPSASSTNYLSLYPSPTFAIQNLTVLNYEPQNCSAWGLFNESDSDSFTTEGEKFEALSFEFENVTGIWVKDTVVYGDAILPNVSFGLVDDSLSDSFGVFGLGLPSSQSTWLTNGTHYDSFIDNLKYNGYINKSVYSLYENYLTNGSSLLFGGVDLEQFIGNLTILPLIEVPVAFNDSRNASAIAITLSSIYFDDDYDNANDTHLIASGLGAAILDTTSATATLPYYVFDEIVHYAGFNYSESLEAFVANSSQLENKTLILDFQGVEVDIPILDLTFPLVDISGKHDNAGEFVVFGVSASPNTYVLGDVILQYLYVAVDLDDLEIAIAPKNFEPLSEDIVAVTSHFPNATSARHYNYTYGYHGVTDLKLNEVHNPNSVTKTSFSLSYIPSATPFSITVGDASSTTKQSSNTKKAKSKAITTKTSTKRETTKTKGEKASSTKTSTNEKSSTTKN